MYKFAAIDFETANHYRDSACSIGIVIVSNGLIKQRVHRLIKPPTSSFIFTNIHGLTWRDVKNEGTFKEQWPKISLLLKKVDFLAAHNAKFDKSVLNACCINNGINQLNKQYVCTMDLARKLWGIYPTKLPDVCNFLGIKLKHHNALSDADACAQIIIAATHEGWSP